MKNKAQNTLRETIAQEFVKALNENQLPWHSMWISQRAYNATNGTIYRGVNALWLAFNAELKGYSDPRWCTFKQAVDNGWNVRKGEKGTQVEFWSVYDTKTRETVSFNEMDRIISLNPDRKDDMRILSKHYTVFNAAQIDGIPEHAAINTDIDIASIRAQRDTLLQNMGLTFKEGGNAAFYRPSDDSLTMPLDSAFKDDYSYMSVLLHECGHATGHESRFNRDLSGRFGSESYAKEELRAEIASAFTSQALGFKANDEEKDAALENHKAYIQSWAKAITDAPNELFAAIKDAEKISDYLLEKGEFERIQKAREPLASEAKQHESVEALLKDATVRAEKQDKFKKYIEDNLLER